VSSISFDLSEDDLARLADRVANEIIARLAERDGAQIGWLDAHAAAKYAGCSIHSLHKATAAREVRFAQSGEGGKYWFKAAWLDDWREGRPPSWDNNL
jgi:hypothetical protein